MDKPVIEDAKTSHDKCEVHKVPGGALPVHEAYGLRVFFPQRRENWPPLQMHKPRIFQFYGLSHLISGRGWYWTPSGKVVSFREGQGVLSSPGFVQNYGGDHSVYSEDSICFSGPLADHLFRSGIIRNGVLTIGKVRRLLPIMELVTNPTDASQIKANIALQNLLIDLHFENINASPSASKLRLDVLLETISASPQRWWTVAEMAEMCNLSEVQFRRVFREHTGIAPKQYVDRLKIQKASERLCSSRATVAEIASEFGYMDPYHFSRRFKTIIGFSPQRYRERFAFSD